jgi:hypothetical protein
MVLIDGYYADGVADRDIRLVVFGNPFAMPQDVFARTVEGDLRDTPLDGAPTHPTLTPGPTAKPIYRLIYVFDPAPATFGNAICELGLQRQSNPDFAPPSAMVPPQPGHVKAVAAFCVEYRSVSEISGQVDATMPADVGFYRLVREMEGRVFRRDSPTRNFPIPLNSPQKLN